MQNIIKKFKKAFSFFGSRLFYFILGLSFVVIVYSVNAAYSTKVSNGTALTSTLWNDMVDQVVALTSSPAKTSGSYLGSCSAPVGGTCTCVGATIMLMTGNSAGITGYCQVNNQGTASVQGACDGASASGSVFACFN